MISNEAFIKGSHAECFTYRSRESALCGLLIGLPAHSLRVGSTNRCTGALLRHAVYSCLDRPTIPSSKSIQPATLASEEHDGTAWECTNVPSCSWPSCGIRVNRKGTVLVNWGPSASSVGWHHYYNTCRVLSASRIVLTTSSSRIARRICMSREESLTWHSRWGLSPYP